MRKIMACLDVGSDTVKCVVGEMVKKKLNILAVAEHPSFGVKNGLVKDPNVLLEPLTIVIQKCEEIIGLKIRQLIVSVPANQAVYSVVESSIEIQNEGYLIEGIDVVRVSQRAVKNNKLPDLEYISMLPTSFILDDNRVVKDPKGLTSKVLKVRGVMVSTPKENIYPILACLERLEIDVLDIALDAIGDYFSFKDKELDKEIGVIVNIGAETSTVSIFNKGVLTNSSVILLGGNQVDNDISFIYKVDNQVAKELKENFALANKSLAQTGDLMEVSNHLNDTIVVSQLEVSEMVSSRILEILNLCKKEINHLTKKEISYIIFTGGLTECKDFALTLHETFGEEVTLGLIKEIGVRHNKYNTCVGLIKYYAYMQQLKNKDFSIFSIEEQQIFSGSTIDGQEESIIGKLFDYIFNS